MMTFNRLGKFLLELNFYVAVLVVVGFCLLSVSDNVSVFNFNEDLYGALDNNLRVMIVYLGITEIVVFAYCWLTHRFQGMTLVGFFLLLLVESVQFYGEVNAIEIDEVFPLFFLYTGLSHLAFGILSIFENNRLKLENSRAE